MVSPIRSRLKQSIAAGTLALAALTLSQTSPDLRFVPAAFALSQDVSIDNLSFTKDKAKITIKSAVFQGTNLSKEEITKLLTGAASGDEAKALLAKLSASKVSIPEVVVTADKATATARGFAMSEVNAGKAASVALAGVDVVGQTDKGDPVNVKGGTLAIADVDFGVLLDMATGEFGKGAFRYSKFDWAGAEATFADPETPKSAAGGNLVKIKIGQFYGANTYDGDVFKQGDAVLKSSTVELPKASKAAAALAAFGYDKVEFSFTTQGDYNQTNKKLNLNDYTVSSAGAGAIGLKAQMGNIEKAALMGGDPAKTLAAYSAGDVSGFSLRYANTGLFEKAVAFLAAQEKKKPEQLKQEWSGQAQAIIPAIMGGDPAGKKLADAIAAFIANPKSLTISAKAKAGSIPFKDFIAMKNPLELLPKIDLTAVANQ